MQRLRRAFWSLYGRFVWDAQKEQAQVQRIVEIICSRRVEPGERVLDAGCGTGNHALGLARAGFEVVGIDYAAGMLVRARDKMADGLSADKLSFRQADLNAPLEFPDACFEHVINVSVLQATSDPAFTLRQLWRVLKPGGTLALLHAPKPESHALPLRQAIRRRARSLDARTPWRVALVAAKVWAERAGGTRYWTVAELEDMLEASQFNTLEADPGPPIIIVAEKLSHLEILL